MDRILVQVKGGAGSGNWGHRGRPGMVGGSGGSGVGLTFAAVSKMPAKEAKAALDGVLEGTGKSSKTKALWSYFKSGVTGELSKMVDAATDAGVPKGEVVAFSVMQHNKLVNGALVSRSFDRFMTPDARSGNVKGVWSEYLKMPDLIQDSFSRVKPATLASWQNAVSAIDEFKGG